ncbi:MAG: RNA methyltransferase [Crocinitomicaceae bacterium]
MTKIIKAIVQSISKNKIKFIKSLHQKKFRDIEKLFLVEGDKIINEIINDHPELLHEIYCTEQSELKHQLSIIITSNDLKQISALKNPNKSIAIVKYLPIQKTTENTLTLVLDDIQDPGNMGTITRLADWYGIKNIICSENTVDCFNPKVVQATMGALFRVNITYTSIEKYIKNSNKIIYGTLLNGKNIYTQNLNTENSILIIGNEGHGISEKIKTLINEPITIPKKGLSESLNASVATGIVLSEFFRTELAK